MIDPQKTIVVCFEYGGYAEDGRLRRLPILQTTARWLAETFPQDHIFRLHYGPYLCARNRAIRDIVLPKAEELGCDWFVSVDNDVTITHPGVEHFMEIAADVVSCECRMRNHHAWGDEDSFHTPLWRCRVEVLRCLDPPWFNYLYSEDLCELLSCDCSYFRDRTRAAGFTIRHGGYCGHGNYNSTWYPNRPGEIIDRPLVCGLA